MKTAFYYHPDGYETSRQKLMGRHAAGEEFLKALSRYSPEETFYCYADDRKHFEHFAQKVGQYSPVKRKCTWIPWIRWRELSNAGALFMPGPNLADLSWQRRHADPRAYSLIGVTHTTATERVMDGLGALLTAPMQPWDALICTSHSVRQMVVRVIANYAGYLQERFGMAKLPSFPMQLPVIPLGIDCAAFNLAEDKRLEVREKWREKLGIAQQDFVSLFFGRLSFHEKAHPMPMYLGLERAAQRSEGKFHLVMAGWFENDSIKKEFVEGARSFCPSVNVIFVDGRQAAVRQTIWHAADIFTSLSDNIQETFGLTPIEAMAAGLPVVVSDWDGYKETVRDGVDGYRVPTWMPPAGFGTELALMHALGVNNYGQYVGFQSQYTAVDVEAAAQAYERLANDAAVRKQMGEAGRERARTTYDWRAILPAYHALWNGLADLRGQAEEVAKRQGLAPGNPLRDDPNSIFGHYPSHTINPQTLVAVRGTTSAEQLKQALQRPMNTFAGQFLYPKEKIEGLLGGLSTDEPVTVQELCAKVPMAEGRALLFTLGWLGKMGLITLAQPDVVEQEPEAKPEQEEEIADKDAQSSEVADNRQADAVKSGRSKRKAKRERVKSAVS